MKRKTKIMLLSAAVIIFMGIVMCLAGAAIGSSRGEQIFPENTEEGRRYTYYFGDSEIGRVKFDAVKAQVNIVGGAERSYMEVINFNENLCTFSNSNAMVTFKENPDVSSALRFWESGFTFKGLRYILRSGGSPDGGIINVYLAQDVKVKAFEITVENGKVNVSDIDTPTDYSITVGSGGITMKNITTTSFVTLTAQQASAATVSLDKVYADTLTVKAQIADVKATDIRAHGCDVIIRTGSTSMTYAPPEGEKFTVEVNSMGKLIIDGCTDYMDTYKYVPADDNKKKKTDEEPAFVRITGADLSVDLDTPLPDAAEE